MAVMVRSTDLNFSQMVLSQMSGRLKKAVAEVYTRGTHWLINPITGPKGNVILLFVFLAPQPTDYSLMMFQYANE